ncbi:MAG TPA: ABC transporter ATP-binding protein [Capillibacterium sp.]
MAQVELVHVTKRFGKVTAVNDLNLKIEEGECFSMLGPSGCGKTTTLRMLAGFEDLDEGEVIVGDKIYSSRAKKIYIPPNKRNFAMVFQAFAVWPHMNVYENVAFPLKYRRLPKAEIKERVDKALLHTGLTKVKESYPNELSGGQQQRIALARAIALNPTLMLLDEPLSNLDPKLREEMRFEIKELQRKFNYTVIFVTHDQAEAMAISDRMMIMKEGVLQQVDTPMNIYNHPANKFVFGFVGLSNFIPVLVKDGGAVVESAPEAGVLTREIPAAFKESRATLACRPSEIQFVSAGEGGVRGVVKRRSFLGEVIDYRIMVGATEIRVQKLYRQGVLREGETCYLRFDRLHWYEA